MPYIAFLGPENSIIDSSSPPHLIPFAPFFDLLSLYNAALPLPLTPKNKSLFALEKRLIGPFQGVTLALFPQI
jgi:hypothetical protein